MATRYFTEEKLWELIEENTILQTDGQSGRWSRDITSIVEDTDGKLFEIFWQQGSTESQESDVYPDNYEEVFKTITTKGVVNTSYLTESKLTEINQTKEKGLTQEVDSLKVVADKKAILEESKSISLVDLEYFIETLNKIELLNVNNSMNIDHKITLDYLERLKEVKQLLAKN